MALGALPLLHTKLKAVPSGSSGLGHNCAAVPSSDGAKKSNSDGGKNAPATHGDAKAEAVNNRAAAPSTDQPDDSHGSGRKSTTNGDANAELGSGGAAAQSGDRPKESETDSRNSASAATTEAGAKHPDLMPLDFLLSVMRHPKTPATLRIKMALTFRAAATQTDLGTPDFSARYHGFGKVDLDRRATNCAPTFSHSPGS